MFSNNGKISEKQANKMLVSSVFSSLIFVLPFLSAYFFEKSLVWGLLVFLLLAGLYVLYMTKLAEWYNDRMDRMERNGYGFVFWNCGLVGKLLIIIQVSRYVMRLTFYMLLTISVLREGEVPFMLQGNTRLWSDVLVLLPLSLVALYGAHTNLEKQGRVQEMLFWLLFVPFILMIVLGFGEVDNSVLVPQVDMPFSEIFKYAYTLLVFVLPVEHLLFLRHHVGNHYNKRWVFLRLMLTLLFAVGLSFFIIGIYGRLGAGWNNMVTIESMRFIPIPFKILERFDVWMIWFVLVGCFVLMCQTLFYVGYLQKGFVAKRYRIWVQFLVLLLALAFVGVFQTYENGLLTYLCYGAWMDIPLSIILPLFGMLVCILYEKPEETLEEADERIEKK